MPSRHSLCVLGCLACVSLPMMIPSAAASGQSAAPTGYPEKVTDVEQAVAGQSLVIGSVGFLKDGKEKDCGVFTGPACKLIILPPLGSRAIIYPFHGKRAFSWSLPPGEYLVLGFEYVDMATTGHVPMRAHFTVPASGNTVYVGDLAIVSSGNSKFAALHRGYDTAVADYRAKHPDRQQPENGTLQAEEDLGTASAVKYVCGEGWGISCTRQFRGVVPVSPADVRGFKQMPRLDPSFEWQPSTDPQVAYDVAVYEAAEYSGRRGASSITGRLAAYRQGLTSPRFQLDRPLLPARKYFWSVRLRKGETVSDWSTYSYFNFYIIAASSGYGQWFSFSTPDQ